MIQSRRTRKKAEAWHVMRLPKRSYIALQKMADHYGLETPWKMVERIIAETDYFREYKFECNPWAVLVDLAGQQKLFEDEPKLGVVDEDHISR